MINGYLTQTDLVNMKINIDSGLLVSKRLMDLINSHLKSDSRNQMEIGLKYYDGKHDILNFKPYYWVDGIKKEDVTKANHKLPHLFHKILVDQKASYVVGNPIVISLGEQGNKDSEKENVTVEEVLMDVLGDEFDDDMNDWVLAASNQGSGWIHLYIDEDGDFQSLVCNSEELIPVFDTSYQKNLVAMIRYYKMDVVDETSNGNNAVTNKRYRIEWWTDKDVTYYMQNKDNDFVKDSSVNPNPAGHFQSYNSLTPTVKLEKGWGKVPFVELPNNSKRKTDLEGIKPLIDAYDKVKSGWINDLDDFQELILIVKGFNALTSKAQQGLSELGVFLNNLKTNKVISVDEDGGVDSLSVQIPVEAKDKFLQITREEIFYFGQGVDVTSDKFGNAPSGISLKFLYSLLDMKANTLIRKMTKSLTKFMWFAEQFVKMKKIKGADKFDSTKLVFTFNKAVIFNEKEKVDMLVASEGIISDQTILENHPLVQDAVEEQARIDAESEKKQQQGLVDLMKFQMENQNNPPDPNNPDNNDNSDN